MATRVPIPGGGGFVGKVKSGVALISVTGKIDLPLDKIAAAIAPDVIGHIKRRVARGLDIHDQPFAPYSAEYRQRLRDMGEDDSKVDLWLTGGLLNSVSHVETKKRPDGIELIFAPDSGTSPQVAPRGKGGAASRTGKRGPAHNIVGAWLQKGFRNMPPRPWLGISPSGMKQLVAKLRRLVLRSGK